VGADEWPDAPGHVGHGRGFDGHDHQVLLAQIGRILAGHQRGANFLVTLQQHQAVLLQGFECGASRHRAQAAALLRQVRPDPAANGASAVNTNFHVRHPLSCRSTWRTSD
jgi:hypothetical protein